MTTADKPLWRHLARVTIEFITPFLVGSGEGDAVADATFAADANGLPILPGSGIAGVLRAACLKRWGDKARVDGLFGFQAKDKGQGSRLSVSWGCLHNSANRPVEGRLMEADIARDKVLAFARQSLLRDHVRINGQGVVDGDGKFDERAVAAGHRFTFELMLESSRQDCPEWDELLALLFSGELRLGGKTRRGYGAFKVVALRERAYDLRNVADFDAWRQLPVSLKCSDGLADTRTRRSAASCDRSKDLLQIKLDLVPEGFWMIGGGYDDNADMAPVKEMKVAWAENKGTVAKERPVLPATAVKGPLAHRTAFYWNALSGCFIGGEGEKAPKIREDNPAVVALFGRTKNKGKNVAKDKEHPGRKGCVIIDDLYLDSLKQKPVNHVSIDRFTGGARDGALFSEHPISEKKALTVSLRVSKDERVDDTSLRALRLAITDLAEGRLALGSGASRGNGYFTTASTIDWTGWPELED